MKIKRIGKVETKPSLLTVDMIVFVKKKKKNQKNPQLTC